MAEVAIVGNDGAFTGFGASGADHAAKFSTWSLNVARVVSPTTEFGDASAKHRGGVATYSGTAAGVMSEGAANTEPGLDSFQAAGSVVTLTAAGSTWGTALAVISGADVSMDKNGDATISFSYIFDGAPTETWVVS